MAVSREQAQIDIIINGTKATSTIAEMEKAAKTLNTQIKNLTPGTQEFIDKSKELQGVNARLSETRNQVKGVAEQTKGLTDNMTKLTPVGGIIGDIGEKAKGIKDGFTQGVKAVTTFGGALAATGIGLFLLAISSLVAYFKKTDDGAKLLEGIMIGLGLVMKTLTSVFISFGEAMVKAVNSPKKALLELVSLIEDNIKARFESMSVFLQGIGKIMDGDIKGGILKVTDSVIQFNTGVRDGTDKMAKFGQEIAKSVEEGIALADMMDDLGDRQREYQLTAAKSQTAIDELLLKSKNQNLSNEERTALLTKAGEIEKSLHAQKLIFAKEEERIAQIQLDQATSRGEKLDDAEQKVVDAQVKQIELARESIQIQEKIANRKAILDNEYEKERQRLIQEGLNADKNIADLKISNMEDGFKKQMAQLQLNYDREKESVVGNEKQINEQKKLLKDQFDQEKKALEEAEELRKQEASIKKSDAELEQAILQNALKYSTIQGSEQEQADALYEIQKAALERKYSLLQGDDEKTLEAKRKTDNELIKLEIDRNKQVTNSRKKSAADSAKIEQAQLNATKGVTGDLLDLMVDAQGEQAKATEAYKAVAIANLIISGVQEVANIWSQASQLGPIAGPILAALQTGFAVARTAIGINKITSVKPAAGKSGKYGMLVHGSAHGSSYGQGGIALIDRVTGEERGEMEGNEIVLTGGVTRNPQLRARASALNQAGGGVAFAGGGMVDAPGTSSANANELSTVTPDAILKGFESNNEKLVASIDARFDRLSVVNSYTDQKIYDDKIKAIQAEREI